METHSRQHSEGIESNYDPEVLITSAELDFFKDYAKQRGYKKAMALADSLNFPNTNIEQPIERQSVARKRRAGLREEEKRELHHRAELGAFEFKTSEIIARTFQKSIDQATKDGLVKGDVVINVIDNEKHCFVTLAEFQKRLSEGTEGLKMLGVVASIEGDDTEGANVLIRNDMDALQMASGEIKHQCGHHVHSGWAAMNVEGLIEYKKKFGTLPFKRVTFISESNEEGNPAAGEQVGPTEMLKSGFKEKYGGMDIVMGAHVIAFLPEKSVRIERIGFHGAADFVFKAKPNSAYDSAVDNDPRLIPSEVARLINLKFKADEPSDRFGKRSLVETDDGTIVPELYVRLTAVQESASGDAYENLAINSLPAEVSYTGVIDSSISEEEISQIVDQRFTPCIQQGFVLKKNVRIDPQAHSFSITIETAGAAHVAFGGPNPRQIMGEILHEIAKRGTIHLQETIGGIKFGGTMRLGMVDYKEVATVVFSDLEKIVHEALKNLHLEGKVDASLVTQNRNPIPPVINDTDLIAQSKKILAEAGVAVTQANLPNAASESFSAYEAFLASPEKQNMIYILIGGMKKQLAEHLQKTKEPVPQSCMHHSDEFAVQDTAIPHGIVLDALLIQFARSWKARRYRGG